MAVDYSDHKELYMANEAGGEIVLTLEPCAFTDAKKLGFENRSYATIADGSIKEEGCWLAPDMKDAPQVQGIAIIPIVNLWYDNIILPFPQNMFEPRLRARKDTI